MAVQKNDGNTNKAAKNNSGGGQKPISTKTLTGALLVLLAAVGIGMVIRELRLRSVEQEPVLQTPVTTQPAEETKVSEITQEPEMPIIQPTPVIEVVVEPEPVPQEQVQIEQQDNQAAMQQYIQQMRNAGQQWGSWFSTLTPEERQVLMQSSRAYFVSLMQRWQNIPPEQAQAEQAQLQQMFMGGATLSNENIQAIQQQIEQMLQSGQQ